MTISYQPSAAGISWLVLSQTLDNRSRMQQDLLKLSAENSKVQITMTQNNADYAETELANEAEGQRQSAIFTMVGAGAGIAATVGVSIGAIKTMPENAETKASTSIGIEKAGNMATLADEVEMKDMSAKVDGNTNPASDPVSSKTAASPAKEGQTTPLRASLNHLFSQNGNLLSQALSDGIKSFGSLQQANYTTDASEAKKIEAIAQGLATVMNQQSQMLSGTISSCDSFFNNLEGSITSIIQVSAVRG